MLLPTQVWLILEIWQYLSIMREDFSCPCQFYVNLMWKNHRKYIFMFRKINLARHTGVMSLLHKLIDSSSSTPQLIATSNLWLTHCSLGEVVTILNSHFLTYFNNWYFEHFMQILWCHIMLPWLNKSILEIHFYFHTYINNIVYSSSWKALLCSRIISFEFRISEVNPPMRIIARTAKP